VDERGGRKDVPENARVVPVLNMVDDPESERVAREVADGILSRPGPDRVVLTRLIDEEPVVAVVDR
jgi:hypothetical protein